MGLIYVNPEGPNGNPDPLAVRQGHPRDLRPHGDGRRGDGGAHRRRPHVRQVPRRRRPRSGRPRARGLSHRAPGHRVEELLRHRQGHGRDHQRARGRMDAHADDMGQRLLRDAVRLRVGADQESGRREPVEAEGRRRRGCGARRAGRVGPTRPDDADDGPRAAAGPDLRADLPSIPGEPGPARRRVREGVVQAAPSRHGSRLALPRPVGPRAAAVAGPRTRRRPRADRRAGHRCPQGARSSRPGRRSPSSSPPPGRPQRASVAPTSGAGRTERGSGSRRRRTGRSTSRASSRRCCRRSSRSSRTSTARSPEGRRCRSPI